MKGLRCLVCFLLLLIIQNSWQVPLQAGENSSSQTAVRMVDEEKDLSDMKRHSEGSFSNDYSNYMEDRRTQDFIQWLMNSKRSGTASKRHADGTYTSDVSSYLQDQAAKEFVTWLKSGRTRRESVEDTGEDRGHTRRHVDGSFTSDVTKVLDSMAAKEYLLWVMTSNPSGASNKRQAHL